MLPVRWNICSLQKVPSFYAESAVQHGQRQLSTKSNSISHQSWKTWPINSTECQIIHWWCAFYNLSQNTQLVLCIRRIGFMGSSTPRAVFRQSRNKWAHADVARSNVEVSAPMVEKWLSSGPSRRCTSGYPFTELALLECSLHWRSCQPCCSQHLRGNIGTGEWECDGMETPDWACADLYSPRSDEDRKTRRFPLSFCNDLTIFDLFLSSYC